MIPNLVLLCAPFRSSKISPPPRFLYITKFLNPIKLNEIKMKKYTLRITELDKHCQQCIFRSSKLQ